MESRNRNEEMIYRKFYIAHTNDSNIDFHRGSVLLQINKVHKINEMSNKKLKLKARSHCIALRQQIMTNIKI